MRCTAITSSFLVLFFLCSVLKINSVYSNGELDEFNYEATSGNSYGPSDWNQVQCLDLQKCRGWPDTWEMGIDWELEENSW